jgi:ribosome maturation factor RimP
VGFWPTFLIVVAGMFLKVSDRELEVMEAVRPVVSTVGARVIDVVVAPELVRVYVDMEGGIDIETLAEISLRLSAAPDVQRIIPSTRYSLEVSSPGLERELRSVDQIKWALGRKVSVRYRRQGSGELARDVGLLVSASEAGITVEAGATVVEIPYESIDSIRTVFDFPRSFGGSAGRGPAGRGARGTRGRGNGGGARPSRARGERPALPGGSDEL